MTVSACTTRVFLPGGVVVEVNRPRPMQPPATATTPTLTPSPTRAATSTILPATATASLTSTPVARDDPTPTVAPFTPVPTPTGTLDPTPTREVLPSVIPLEPVYNPTNANYFIRDCPSPDCEAVGQWRPGVHSGYTADFRAQSGNYVQLYRWGGRVGWVHVWGVARLP